MTKRTDLPNVMVAGAHSMGALGVIRSLGRAGYTVHAVAASPDAIGLRSNFARHKVVHPPSDTPEFEAWLTEYIRSHQIALIIPGGPIAPGGHPALKQYGQLFPVSNDEVILSKGGKYELFAALLDKSDTLKENLPPVLLVDFEQRKPSLADLAPLACPQFIKLDGAHARSDQGERVIRCATAQDTLTSLTQLSADYRKAIVQGFVPGAGVGVFILRWNGQTVAKFMHRRLHEMPHTGGASSLRESWWHEKIFQDAQAKLACINWQGVAMIEYRWDPGTDHFYLMEMNLRFWGSIHLGLYAGVDFPKLLADSFFNYPTPTMPVAKIGLKCRNTIPFELGYLVSLWRDKNVPIVRKLYSIWEALWLSLDLRVKNDLLFPGDRTLFWIRLGKFLRTGQ